MSIQGVTQGGPPRVAFYNNPGIRTALYQSAVLIVLAWIGYEVVFNARANLRAQGFASGFVKMSCRAKRLACRFARQRRDQPPPRDLPIRWGRTTS